MTSLVFIGMKMADTGEHKYILHSTCFKQNIWKIAFNWLDITFKCTLPFNDLGQKNNNKKMTKNTVCTIQIFLFEEQETFIFYYRNSCAA